MAKNGTSRHIKTFLQMIDSGKLHAPNLKAAHFWLHRGPDRSNTVMKSFVTKHMLALRWMNPNALVFLRDSPETGTASVEFELWNGRRSGFSVSKSDSPEKVVAKLMFAARDPGLDGADVASVLNGETVSATEPKDGVWEPSEATKQQEAAAASSADGDAAGHTGTAAEAAAAAATASAAAASAATDDAVASASTRS